MDVKEHQGLRYYSACVSRKLTEDYDFSVVRGPHGLTGNYLDEAAVWPFLCATNVMRKVYGFDKGGFDWLVDHFASIGQEVNMAFAKGRINNEIGLDTLTNLGHLRRAEHEGRNVYFPSEMLLSRAFVRKTQTTDLVA